MSEPLRPRVFIDADVLFAGAASPSQQGASLVVLRMAEFTLIEALTSEQVIGEVERNLQEKMPRAMPAFRLLVQRCLQVVPDPTRVGSLEQEGRAHEKDLPILVAAVREACLWLITFNLNDYKPGHPKVKVLRPGDFVQEVRYLLGRMG